MEYTKIGRTTDEKCLVVARKTLRYFIMFSSRQQSKAMLVIPKLAKVHLKREQNGFEVWCFKNSANKKIERMIYIIIVLYMKDIDFILATQCTIFQPRVKSPAALLVWCATPLTVKVWDIFVLPSQIPPLLSLVFTPTS